MGPWIQGVSTALLWRLDHPCCGQERLAGLGKEGDVVEGHGLVPALKCPETCLLSSRFHLHIQRWLTTYQKMLCIKNHTIILGVETTIA